MNDPIRIECYIRIRDYAKKQIIKHFDDHPEDLSDPRIHERLEQSIQGYRNLFDILDDYNFTRREK